MGLFPIGETMANAFARKGSVFWLIAFSFAIGFGTTVAEPTLIAIADEAAYVAAQGGMIENTDFVMREIRGCCNLQEIQSKSGLPGPLTPYSGASCKVEKDLIPITQS